MACIFWIWELFQLACSHGGYGKVFWWNIYVDKCFSKFLCESINRNVLISLDDKSDEVGKLKLVPIYVLSNTLQSLIDRWEIF